MGNKDLNIESIAFNGGSLLESNTMEKQAQHLIPPEDMQRHSKTNLSPASGSPTPPISNNPTFRRLLPLVYEQHSSPAMASLHSSDGEWFDCLTLDYAGLLCRVACLEINEDCRVWKVFKQTDARFTLSASTSYLPSTPSLMPSRLVSYLRSGSFCIVFLTWDCIVEQLARPFRNCSKHIRRLLE